MVFPRNRPGCWIATCLRALVLMLDEASEATAIKTYHSDIDEDCARAFVDELRHSSTPQSAEASHV